MTLRCFAAFAVAAVLLLCALSTGGALFWLMFLAVASSVLCSLCAVLWTRATLSVRCRMESRSVTRGETAGLLIQLRHRCPLPVATFTLRIVTAEGESFPLSCGVHPMRARELRVKLACNHVGRYPLVLGELRIHDPFGFFSMKAKTSSVKSDELTVLPQVHLTEPLTFSPGDSDEESPTARAFEDATLPTDLRAYQPGDELKKIHWKLSMRRRELLVRVYEQPAKPDALLLVDCAPPQLRAEATEADMRDIICEAAASVASIALQAGAPVRMPLLAAQPDEVSVTKTEELPRVQEALARCRFDGATEFERLLQLETRRMRRTGSTAIVTSRMNPVIADMVLRIRRMGPKVRVLLAADEKDAAVAALIQRLMRNDVEVTPIAMAPVAAEPSEEEES